MIPDEKVNFSFASPVTRSYTLHVANAQFGLDIQASEAHIVGWNVTSNGMLNKFSKMFIYILLRPELVDWIYNEAKWQQFDQVLALAAKEGVKIIFPFINQDFGTSETDWWGNYIDLIRYRYNLTDYATAQQQVDWFTDLYIREDFKKIITFALNRQNTVNGRIYGLDDTFLCFETGNEMNWTELIFRNSTTNSTSVELRHLRPAPANWTIDIAQHIKSLAPNTLVMDGSYSRIYNVSEVWPEETLRSPFVDLFSYHGYGDADIAFINRCVTHIRRALDALRFQQRVEAFNKTFVVGEHGFYSSPAKHEGFYANFTGAGALAWSLRPHSEVSGFITHGEGNNIFSFHAPGWRNQTDAAFDQIEYDVVRGTYEASYKLLQHDVAPYPIPHRPYAFFATNGSSVGISFKGAAWAERYEIWAAGSDQSDFVKVADDVLDNVNSGNLFIPIDPTQPTAPLRFHREVLIRSNEDQSGWKDTKWKTGGSESEHKVSVQIGKQVHVTINPLREDNPSTAQSESQSIDGSSLGGWYTVRGVSVDGYYGPFSHPTFVSTLEVED
ncbi:family 5 glycoside hydrolase [Melampsora larici-populina 98AG31]|uniref:mannan endo-1,4-beta-mannosidase n=1 Tax=Melampsora larici-populina (strain 98AG31 / pathotype 3-4-7) TaxID=747676 RepID=F4RT21_MELLP|nr:family 5 glycoside hydrolase [Melampsora larici-populina 98AG31]EGG04506.1 family 5 glycoside hydrolase [Melampsora larici-populina 98AG31]